VKIILDTGTMPDEVFQPLLRHPLTDIGPEGFLADRDDAGKDLGARAGH
jgi:hypothetical protein